MMNPADAFRITWEKSFHRFNDVRFIQPVGGGSIHHVFRADTEEGSFIMKINSSSRYPGMFKAESQGLLLLANTGAIGVPETVAIAELAQHQVLIIEYIEPSPRKTDFFADFGRKMAALHRTTAEKFGLPFHNYIGSLPQDNGMENSLPDFFMKRRLQPQLRLALRKGRLTKTDADAFDRLFAKSDQLLPPEKPSLVHGDLWNGNYISGNDGTAWLIDPAVSYYCREADIAMSKLFGGFDTDFYGAYHEAFPLEAGWEERIGLWNLYPLLVHVNLFGGGYIQEVRNILKRFTDEK